MTLGFYYHLPLFGFSTGYRVPTYLGVFLDALACEFDELYLFLHLANPKEAELCDYILKSSNIRYVNLGLKTAAWERFLFPMHTIKRMLPEASLCDIFLVRAPSPLAPFIYENLKQYTLVTYLVVGDYSDGVRYLHQPMYRKVPIRILSNRNDRQLRRSLKKTLTMVNSSDLLNKYKSFTPNLRYVRTTTIDEKDFFFRTDTCLKDDINILYTGRLDVAKGLRELVKAVAILRNNKFKIKLHFASWEDDPKKPVEHLLSRLATENHLIDRIVFHGRKALGPELYSLYQMADIYTIPSYHEGFPRSIWEAMANGLPVIASNIPSIYSCISDAAILVEPRNIDQISSAIQRVITDGVLRRQLIASGYKKAKENTIKTRVKEIAELMKEAHFENEAFK